VKAIGTIAGAFLALSLPAWALAGTPSCPSSPTLSGPKTVTAGESYALSWTNVLANRPVSSTSTSDGYELQRAGDPAFTQIFDRVRTTRPSQTLGPAPAGVSVVYQRVVVLVSCAAASPGVLASNVFATSIRSSCDTPDGLEGLVVSPPGPPAFSTYVVSWDTAGSGRPGPGGGASGLLFRLRRTWGTEVNESLLEGGSASFQDPPGTYAYQVRAESSCGSVGPWSESLTVVVGAAPVPALALVSDPKPVVAIAGPGASPAATFAVRNGGTAALAVTAAASDLLTVVPGQVTLAPGETRIFSVAVRLSYVALAPYHGEVVLTSDAGLLKVPIDATFAATPADVPVVFSDADAELDDDASPVRRTLINPGATRAAIVGAVGEEWIHVDSNDGQAWDRPLLPGERRVVRIVVDRDKRRAPFGTETGVVSVTTAGFPASASAAKLLVIDDGPRPTVATGVRPSPIGSRTRLLYASMPNARDVLGVGRFTTDVWLTNLDALAPIDVSIWATPIAAAGALVVSSHVDLKLAPGETRRYRNIIGKVMQYDGACEVEVRSPATTLSVTALVANTPTAATTARRAALRQAGTVVTASPAVAGQYGFEMRPTVPGEGVKSSDPSYVLSGLAHDARRRTNVILTETSGVPTTIVVALFGSGGNALLKNGAPVELTVTVPALASVQINDADLFDTGAVDNPYALLYFQEGGSVVPFATVIDAGTEDASLRVGASIRSLTPIAPPAVASVKRTLAQTAALPFGGGPAPLLFPVAHIRGAPLADGSIPYWKTRVTFTNVNETEQRQIEFRIQDQTGNAVTGGGFGFIGLSPKGSVSIEDIGHLFVTGDTPVYGAVVIDSVEGGDGSWQRSWKDVDVQTETYTADPRDTALGDYKTGMEGFSYRHGYSSFQSNLGTVQIEGAESSTRFRTNLILEEVGGAPCTVAVSAYASGSFVPMATATVALPAFGYVSRELFAGVLGLDRSELVDVRLVVRQLDGDGVFMAFASKINLTTGDPANIFLRPASAGTGR
jgi:hypothetical protein